MPPEAVSTSWSLVRRIITVLARLLVIIALVCSPMVSARAETPLTNTLRKIFSTPTPTPNPKKKKRIATATSRTHKKKSSASKKTEGGASQKKKRSSAELPSPSPDRKKKASPSPELSQTPSPIPTSTPLAKPEVSPSPPVKKTGAETASLSSSEIKGFDNYPRRVQQLLNSALELTTRHLGYKYGSADPDNGGMDCSGFIYFVLSQNGIADVPRDSSEQYNWLRRAGAFEPVLSRHDDSFELDNLKPGDLLFWTGTYQIDRDPPITHAMIYLGREKKTGKRVMVGSSDGRVYDDQPRYGVSVFDFKLKPSGSTADGKLQPLFVGYGHIPSLREDEH